VYTVEVSYTPKPGRALEAYSFAEFLESFQDKKILQEELTAEIARKLCATGAVERVEVRLRGIHGSVEVETKLQSNCSERPDKSLSRSFQ